MSLEDLYSNKVKSSFVYKINKLFTLYKAQTSKYFSIENIGYSEITTKAQGVGRIVVLSSAVVGDSWGVVNPELQAVIEKSNIRLVFQDLNRMEQALDDSGLDTLAVRPVALIQGQATGNCELVSSFEKTSRITTGDVAQWMLDAVERTDPFTERNAMIGTPTIS